MQDTTELYSRQATEEQERINKHNEKVLEELAEQKAAWNNINACIIMARQEIAAVIRILRQIESLYESEKRS